jgi:hypothetical protein
MEISYPKEWVISKEDIELGVIGRTIVAVQTGTRVAVQFGLIVIPFMYTMYSMNQ